MVRVLARANGSRLAISTVDTLPVLTLTSWLCNAGHTRRCGRDFADLARKRPTSTTDE